MVHEIFDHLYATNEKVMVCFRNDANTQPLIFIMAKFALEK